MTTTPDDPSRPAPPAAATTTAPHKMAGDTEEVYFHGSPLLRGELGKGLLWLLVGTLLVLAPLLWRIFGGGGKWAVWQVNLGVVIIGLILLTVPFIRAKAIRYRVTNYRIDFQRGFFSTNIDTLELWHVEDLRYHQSLLDRMLGVGTITVLSKHPTTPTLVLHSLPDSRNLFTTLEQRVIAVKRQAGVIKVDSGT